MELHLPYKLLLAAISATLMSGIFFPLNWFPYHSSQAAGLLLFAIGLYLGFRSKSILRSHETTIDPYGSPEYLVKEDIFQYTRNPMYLSYMTVAMGILGLFPSVPGLVPVISYFLYLNNRVIPREEQNLRANFPEEYGLYSKKVRRWI